MFSEIPAAIAYERWLEDKGEMLRLNYPLDENSVVFDIGAHVGDWAHDIITKYNCHIHLFEPLEEFAEQAKERFKTNPKVHVHNYAVLDYNGFADLALNGTGSTLYAKSSNVCRIEVRNIIEVMKDLNIEHIHLAKLNIEGAEFDLLDFMIETGLLLAFDELQIQFHDIFKDSVDRRRRIQTALAHTHSSTYNYAFIWENWSRNTPKVRGYDKISRAAAKLMNINGWDTVSTAAIQHNAFQTIVSDALAGKPRQDMVILKEALAALDCTSFNLLEVGCASGYLSEAITEYCPELVHYTGLDSAAEMISLAQNKYPDKEFITAGAQALPFTDNSLDVVLNGVSLMHTLDYALAIAESARVAKSFCIFHTVPVHEISSTQYLRKFAYGSPVFELNFQEAELLNLFALVGLELIETWESLPYDLSKVIGEDTPTKTYLCKVSKKEDKSTFPHKRLSGHLVNIGCGKHYADGWLNYDIYAQSDKVIQHDISTPLPLHDNSCALVYHSHVLEHLPRWQAPIFLKECFRLLKPGGLLRVAIPDLETICRLYLENLAKALEGDQAAAERREWLTIELMDQMTREESGGDMYRYWQQYPIPEKLFMLSRVGHEAIPMIENVQQQINAEQISPSYNPLFAEREREQSNATDMANFRRSGEVHHWMYDRFSLALLLEECGFISPTVMKADQSLLPEFSRYGIETVPDGDIRKPDSLFIETLRPA